MLNTSREREKQDLCLLKRAVKGLLKRHPRGMTHTEICRHLLSDSGFPGTYRNLTSQAHSILSILIEEETVKCSGNGGDRVYVYVG